MDDFVCSQLESHDLKKYIPAFRENEIDKAAFLQLTAEDLQRLCDGKIGPQRKLQNVIDSLTENSDVHDRVTEWTIRAQDLELVPEFSDPGKVLVYIDNSNVFINTQQHAARQQKFAHGIQSDKRWRIDIGKLLNCVAAGRDILGATLYGSEPPMMDSVWKAIRQKKVVVKTHKKSTWTQREKQIDAALIADAVDDVNKYSNLHDLGTPLTVIVVSGDRDMLEVIKKALMNGWRVEVWSYESALANDMRKLEREHRNGAMQTLLIDKEFLNITFGVYEWKKTFIPQGRSLVLLLDYQIKTDDVKTRVLKDIVTKSSEILRMPMMARVLTHVVDTTDLGGRVSPGCVSTSNRFEALTGNGACAQVSKSLTPVVLICYERAERASNGPNSSSAGAPDRKPKYDFNKHVWAHKEKLQKAIDNCTIILTYQNYCQTHGIVVGAGADGEDDDMIVEDDVDDSDPDSLDVDYNLVAKKEKRSSQLYSEVCIYRFRCKRGTKCTHQHTKEHKEFFKEHPNALRYKYKTKLCHHQNGLNSKCKYHDKPYLCMFAHNQNECYCPFCSQIGNHWPDECPEKPSSGR